MPALLQLEQIQVGGQVESQGVSGKGEGGENRPALLQLEQIQVGGQVKSQGVSGKGGGERICQLCYSWNRFR